MKVVSMLTAVIALTTIDNTVMVPVATAPKSVVSICLGFAIFTVLNSENIKAKLFQNISHKGRNFEVLGVRKVSAVIGSPLIPDTIFSLQSKNLQNSRILVIVIFLDTAELVQLL